MFTRITGLVFLTILIVSILPLTLVYSQKWPWSTSSEPYPWLDYLASLTDVRNVRLVILTRHEQSIQSLTRILFLNSPVAKKLGIIELQFIYEPAEKWPERIRKMESYGLSVDVAWGGGPTLFNVLDEMGFLLSINPDKRPEHHAVLYELSKIPSQIAGSSTYKVDRDGGVKWIGASVSSFGFTVNKIILGKYGLPTPSGWGDLTSPEYAKFLPTIQLIGIADPTKSTSNLRIFEIILQAKGWNEGWKVLTLLAANSLIYPGSGDVRDAVIRGDMAIGTTIDFYGYMAMRVNPNCLYVAPQGETIVNADPVAIVNITKYPVHAAAFVAWVISEYGGQLLWLHHEINRIPVNPETFEIEIPEDLRAMNITERPDLKTSFDNLYVLRGIIFNEELSASWINSVMYYFKATLVNAHDDLQYTWSEIAKAYLENKITRGQFLYLIHELSRPLRYVDPVTKREVEFTLEYAISVNKLLTDASIYQALMSTWETKAREKYQNVLSILHSGNIPEYKPPIETPIPTTTETPTPIQTPIEPGETPLTTPAKTETTPRAVEEQRGISPTLIALLVAAFIVIIVLFLLRRR